MSFKFKLDVILVISYNYSINYIMSKSDVLLAIPEI